MASLRVALVTCETVPVLCDEDLALEAAMVERGLAVSVIKWEDTWEAGKFDVAIVRSCWNYITNVNAFVAWAHAVEASGTKLFNSAALLAWNAHKGYLRDIEAKGLPVVQTLWYEKQDQEAFQKLVPDIQQLGWKEGIVKPSISNESNRTIRLDFTNQTALQNALEHVVELGCSAMVQPFIKEIQDKGEYSFVFFNGQYSHTVRKIPASGDFRVQKALGGSHKLDHPDNSAIALAAKIDAACASHLFSRVDMFLTDNGWLLSELELIEPYLHFLFAEGSIDKFIDALLAMA